MAIYDPFMSKYSDFHCVEKPLNSTLVQMREKVPEPVLSFWQDYGFGSCMNGYFKVVNPADFHDLLYACYRPRTGPATVLFVTSLADFLIWENGYLTLVDCRHAISRVLESGLQFFFGDLCDEGYLEDKLNWQPYRSAASQLGTPEFDECFAYEPLLSLGGSEELSSLRRVKIREHFAVVASLVGAF